MVSLLRTLRLAGIFVGVGFALLLLWVIVVGPLIIRLAHS